METVLCFGGTSLLALPLLILMVKDIKLFIKECISKRSNSAIHVSQIQHMNDSASALIVNVENEETNTGITQIDNIEMDVIDKEKELQIKQNTAIYSPNIGILLQSSSIIVFFSVFIVGYIVSRGMAEIFNYRRNYKYLGSHFQDLFELYLRAFVIYIIGGITNRFKTFKMKIIFAICIIYFLVIYSFTFEICPDPELDSVGIGNASVIVCIVLLGIIGIIGLYLLIRGCYAAFYLKPIIIRNINFISLFILIVFNALMIILSTTKYVAVHLHHHYWSFIAAVLCRSNNKISFLGQTLLIGMMLHSISIFGCEPLIEWINVDVVQFESDCQKWYCEDWKCEKPKIT